jgi:hypothetical protein
MAVWREENHPDEPVRRGVRVRGWPTDSENWWLPVASGETRPEAEPLPFVQVTGRICW